MESKNIAKLALAGILSSGLFVAAQAEGSAKHDCGGKDGCPGAKEKKEAKKAEMDSKYSEVHNCAGKNVCKGLGGCNVSKSMLKKLAEKADVPLEKAGEPHGCAGKNECKGLGGCKVTPEKFVELKAALKK